jgi:hypothetical protein
LNNLLNIDLQVPKFIQDEKGELNGHVSLEANSEMEIEKITVGLDALYAYPEKEKFNQKRAFRLAEEVVAESISIGKTEMLELPFSLSYRLKTVLKEDPMFQMTGKWGEKMKGINAYMQFSAAKYQLVVRIELSDGSSFREYVEMRFA